MRRAGIVLVVATLVAAVGYGAVVLMDQYNEVRELNYDGWRGAPWRFTEPVQPHTQQILLVIDGRACREYRPGVNSTVVYGAESITIAVTVQDAAESCIPSEQVTIPVAVNLTQVVGSRSIVDPNATP